MVVKIRILGSCAGGGLPQWNCGCSNCVRARAGDRDVPARTQPSIAVSADGDRWSVLNAAPDIRQQLAAFPGLHPRPGTRDLPLDTILLTSAELDHALGLLILREALSYRIVSTPWVRDVILENNAAFRLLEPAWSVMPLDRPFPLDGRGGLEARLFPVPGKVPGWARELAKPSPEMCAAVRLTSTATGTRLVYAPGVKSLDDATWAEVQAARCAFVDGTFFTRDELRAHRPGAPDAIAMGHLPITGAEGSLERLASHEGRRFYIHMNNTNPVLDRASDELGRVERAGVEVAMDGAEFEL
jgi:pyrroloquinoline quinone biosynthesis protein B